MALETNPFDHLSANFFLFFPGKGLPFFVYRVPPGIVNDPEADIVGSLVHMAACTGWSPAEVLSRGIDGSMEGGSVHLIVRAGQPGVAFFTSLWLPRLFRVEGVGSVAAIALVLNAMTPLAKGLLQRVGKGLVLTVFPHSVPRDRMPAFLELVKFFSMTLGADLGFDSRLLWHGLLVAFMTGNTIHPAFGMFAVDPGLKDPPGILLMAGQAVADLFLCNQSWRREKKEKSDG